MSQHTEPVQAEPVHVLSLHTHTGIVPNSNEAVFCEMRYLNKKDTSR